MRLAQWVRNASLAIVAALTSCVVVDEGPISPDPQYCPQVYAPVCARRGDDRRTFPNDCYAEREGYYVIRDGECRRDRPEYPDQRPPRPPQSDRPQACPMIYAPVCAQRGNDRQTFENACQANAAGYGVIRQSECRGDGGQRPPGGPGGSVPGGVPGSSGPSQPPVTNQPPQQPGPPGACTREFAPVCGTVGGARQTFSNACMAREAGARQIRPGQC